MSLRLGLSLRGRIRIYRANQEILSFPDDPARWANCFFSFLSYTQLAGHLRHFAEAWILEMHYVFHGSHSDRSMHHE